MKKSLVQSLNDILEKLAGTATTETAVVVKKSGKKNLLALNFIEECRNMSSDYKSMKMYSLYRRFGYAKRGGSNTAFIANSLLEAGLYCYPKLDSPEIDWKKTDIRVYKFPHEALGTLFEDERELEDFIHQYSFLKKIGITKTTRQHAPIGSSSKMDFRGEDEKGNLAVIELKKWGGDNRGVEQVMKYKNELQERNEGRKIRKILITGIRDVNTAKAIWYRSDEDMQNFEWYIYKFDTITNSIDFELVTNEFLNEHFARIKRDFLSNNE